MNWFGFFGLDCFAKLVYGPVRLLGHVTAPGSRGRRDIKLT